MVLSACPAPHPLQATSQRVLQDRSLDQRGGGQDQLPWVLSPMAYQAYIFLCHPLDFEKQQV